MPTSRNRLPNETFSLRVATRLRMVREEMSLNQTDFAELGGVKRSSQLLYEAVQRFPDTRYFECLEQNDVDINAILCNASATNTLNPSASVLQRIFMLSAGVSDPNHPSVELFRTLCSPCVDRANPEEVDLIFRALSQFRRAAG